MLLATDRVQSISSEIPDDLRAQPYGERDKDFAQLVNVTAFEVFARYFGMSLDPGGEDCRMVLEKTDQRYVSEGYREIPKQRVKLDM